MYFSYSKKKIYEYECKYCKKKFNKRYLSAIILHPFRCKGRLVLSIILLIAFVGGPLFPPLSIPLVIYIYTSFIKNICREDGYIISLITNILMSIGCGVLSVFVWLITLLPFIIPFKIIEILGWFPSNFKGSFFYYGFPATLILPSIACCWITGLVVCVSGIISDYYVRSSLNSKIFSVSVVVLIILIVHAIGLIVLYFSLGGLNPHIPKLRLHSIF